MKTYNPSWFETERQNVRNIIGRFPQFKDNDEKIYQAYIRIYDYAAKHETITRRAREVRAELEAGEIRVMEERQLRLNL